MTGNAVMIRNWVTSVIQVNTGNRIIFIPGARMFRMVTMKLNPAASDEIPSIWRPSTHQPTVRLGQLRPDDQRLDAADQEERERRPEVQQADPLVIGGREPARESPGVAHFRLSR